MATARNYLNVTTDVTISTTGTVAPAQQNLAQLADGSSVQFQNDAPYPVNLEFTAEFGEVPIARGKSSGDLSASEVTVNYTIYDALTNQPTGGPYSIQWGNGPLTIDIAGVTPSPASASVAEGGKIQFDSDSEDGIQWTYTVGGGTANVWNPQPTDVASGENGEQTALPGVQGNFTYTLSSTVGTNGKGTIKIGSQ
jgi:hypothetical protein